VNNVFREGVLLADSFSENMRYVERIIPVIFPVKLRLLFMLLSDCYLNLDLF